MNMNMNARLIGSGKQTLVLSHGYGGSQSVWDNMIPHLSESFRVLLFDWNFSAAANNPDDAFSAFAGDLISLVDDMKLKATVFIGHSMAGMIGCIASIKRPDLFSHLVLLGASPRYLNSEDYEGGFERFEVDDMLVSIESNFHTWAQSFVPLVVGVNDPISIQKFGRSFHAMRPETALSLAKAIFLSDLRDVLEKVEVPCTIVQSSNDIVVPTSVAHYMHSKIKGAASVEIVDSDGHFPQLTAHHKLIEVLDRVLASNKL